MRRRLAQNKNPYTAAVNVEGSVDAMALQKLWQKVSSLPQLQELSQNTYKRISVFPRSFLAFLTAHLSANFSQTRIFLLLVPNEKYSQQVYEELKFLATLFNKTENVFWFPSWGMLPYTHSHPDSEKEGFRVQTLCRLAQQNAKEQTSIIVSSADALQSPVLQKFFFTNAALSLSTLQKSTSREEVLAYLANHGYEHVEIVESPGQFSAKGSLIDIFCPAYFNPVRLDFFGEEVDSMRFFDPLSQRSLEKLKEFWLYPRRDIFPFDGNWQALADQASLLPQVETAGKKPAFFSQPLLSLDGLWDVYPLLFKTCSLLDYLPAAKEKTQILFFEEDEFSARWENLLQENIFLFDKTTDKNENVFAASPDKRFFSLSSFTSALEKFSRVDLSVTPKTLEDFSLHIQSAPSFKGRVSSLLEFMQEENVTDVFIATTQEASLQRLRHILQTYEKEGFQPFSFEAPFAYGFFWKQQADKQKLQTNGIFLSEKDIYGKSARSRKISQSTSQAIESFIDLKENDYVVHVNYGIGRFVGLKRMSAAGHDRDFLELEYADNDKLYVPLEQINLVHRYIGSSENPRLDFLGKKSSWEKVKTRVLASVEKMAEELLQLYALRENSVGFRFPPDTTFQEEFEAQFPYEETDHQLLAITEVKKDMESGRPMDRLVCGDVGFGKTEVAIRAAFKAVMAGKQVAVLCPTTVLAFQHYNTFRKRFESYPVQIDFISRFKTASQIATLRKKTKEGGLDILIGTHALLSEKNEFKNLGLLVIDEEQRFGVVHKDAIKKIKHNVDCLTMTATPIPRTLQLSLTGIRDLSLMETPPRSRKKIETYVLEENDEILKKAVTFELQREGQVYVLHNKVKTMEAQALRLRKLLPQARVAVLHGQMPDDEIESILLDFYRYKFDVLISTTIIESGIDIPLVNTLIVLNAQNFGLSQLYQIKGRVGRSERQAFAYFFYPPRLSLSEVAQKRLNTLQEYDGLGAGFKIAMKDLEIRGAGNILGAEQSGDIMDVGFEMYLQMLNQKIDELRNVERDEFSAHILISQNFYLPCSYVQDTRQKIEIYKKMASCLTMEEMEAVKEEMQDRFGELPEQVEGMWLSESLRVLGSLLRLEKIEMKDNFFVLVAGPFTKISAEKIGSLLQNDKRFLSAEQDAKELQFHPHAVNMLGRLKEFRKVLEYFC